MARNFLPTELIRSCIGEMSVVPDVTREIQQKKERDKLDTHQERGAYHGNGDGGFPRTAMCIRLTYTLDIRKLSENINYTSVIYKRVGHQLPLLSLVGLQYVVETRLKEYV